MTFINKEYEHITREYPYNDAGWWADTPLEQEGWRHIYADVTLAGAFIVYRRKRRVLNNIEALLP